MLIVASLTGASTSFASAVGARDMGAASAAPSGTVRVRVQDGKYSLFCDSVEMGVVAVEVTRLLGIPVRVQGNGHRRITLRLEGISVDDMLRNLSVNRAAYFDRDSGALLGVVLIFDEETGGRDMDVSEGRPVDSIWESHTVSSGHVPPADVMETELPVNGFNAWSANGVGL